MVEFQLFQRRDRSISLLHEVEAPPFELPRLVEPIARRRRLAQKRARDEHDRDDGERAAEDERNCHATAAPAA
jgi:hypothetical protein